MAIHIRETMENPTYVVTDISEPFTGLTSSVYSIRRQPQAQSLPQWQRIIRRQPGFQAQSVKQSANSDRRTRPIEKPRFKLIPHWMPGTIARTMMRSCPTDYVLLNRVDKTGLYPRHKHSKKKNTPMMTSDTKLCHQNLME